MRSAVAQDYPARAVTLAVPFAPGGGTDSLARELGERLPGTVLVANRGGDGRVIAAELEQWRGVIRGAGLKLKD